MLLEEEDEDIDSLLDSIEAGLKSNPAQNLFNQKSGNRFSEDVKELLALTEEANAVTAPSTNKATKTSPVSSATANKAEKQKCNPLIISGSATSTGFATMLKPRSCDNLFCLSCDFRVFFFDDFRWDKSTDYLFLRQGCQIE